MNASAPSTAARVLALLVLSSVAGCLAEGPSGGGPTESTPECTVDVPMRRLTPSQYEHAVTDIFGGHVRASARFPTQAGGSQTGFSNEPNLNTVDRLAAEQIMLAAEDVAMQIPEALPLLAPCAVAAADSNCADTFIRATATRAFRRPPSTDEQAVLRGVFDEARADTASFEDATAMVVATILQSPQFLYTLESGTRAGDVRRLAAYEIATRLSLLLWDSIPDQALLDAARDGRLESPQAITTEARRMLADPKAARMSRRFFREWMRVQELTEASKDPWRHPWYDADLAASIGVGFDTYVHTAMTDHWTLSEFLTYSRAPVDDILAEHLGVPKPAEPWSWVDLDPSRNVGVMTQPAVMASLAHYDESSYVARGRFLAVGLMCRTLGGPPANANAEAASILSELPAGASQRQTSLAVRRNSQCGGCHRTLDPLGLAFENLDATGHWRDTDPHGNVIDASGELATMGLEFAGPRDLMEAIAEREEARDCFERNLFRYFAARLDRESDACVLGQIRTLPAADGSMVGAMMSLIGSDAFGYRRIPIEENAP